MVKRIGVGRLTTMPVKEAATTTTATVKEETPRNAATAVVIDTPRNAAIDRTYTTAGVIQADRESRQTTREIYQRVCEYVVGAGRHVMTATKKRTLMVGHVRTGLLIKGHKFAGVCKSIRRKRRQPADQPGPDGGEEA